MNFDGLRICLDPGHGMSNRREGVYDSGAEGCGLYEADIALQWGLTGKWRLTAAGIGVFMTRDDDRDSDPVGRRATLANEKNCDLFISLHCNRADGKARGQEVFYRDAEDEQLGSVVLNSALHAFGDKARSRGLKTEGESQHSRLAVPNFKGPACLLEAGFIDNPSDASMLTQRSVRLAFWDEFIRQLREVDL